MGVLNEALAAKQTHTKKGVGSMPKVWLTLSARGKARAAAALFVMSSVKMFVMR